MKKNIIGFALAALVLSASGCQKLNDVSDRVDKLESEVSTINKELQTILNALNSHVYVAKVTTTETGYVISFTDGTSATINSGVPGPEGPQGPAGQTGPQGPAGDSWCSKVEVGTDNVTLTLADGKVIVLPLEKKSAVAAIKSLTFIPEYSDGKATLFYTVEEAGTVDLKFMIKPASAAAALKAQEFTLSACGIETMTRALSDETSALTASLVELSEDGLLSVKVTGALFAKSAFKNSNDIMVAVSIADHVTEMASDFIPVMKIKGISIAEEEYPVVRMRDGKIWMTENLRYIPEGVTPQYEFVENTGMWYPGRIVDNGASVSVEPDMSQEAISEMGYLYTLERALGGALPTEDFMDAENKQGICPDGWHIPTAQEWINLVGACANSKYTFDEAPYYDKNLSGASLEKLNADDFNLFPYPFVNGGTKYLGTVSNKDPERYCGGMSAMSYFASSTGRSATQGYVAMITNNATKTSVNVAYCNKTNGVFVRCVHD